MILFESPPQPGQCLLQTQNRAINDADIFVGLFGCALQQDPHPATDALLRPGVDEV